MARRDSDQLTALRGTRYLGSHPTASGQVSGVDVIFTSDEVRFRRRKVVLGQLLWRDVVALEAGNDETVEIDRGVRKSLSYLVVSDRAGRWIFEVPGLSRMELRSGLIPLREFIPPQDEVRTPPAEEPRRFADRLAELQEMFDRRLISEAEFHAKRQQLLDDF